ncbi:hypothetical protein D9M69_582430 [compost metagenome]
MVETLIQVVNDMAAAAKADVHMDVRELRPGMVLARDLVSSRGAILLAAGYVFDERVVKQVGDFSAREGVRLTLWIRKNSIPQDTKPLDVPRSQS